MQLSTSPGRTGGSSRHWPRRGRIVAGTLAAAGASLVAAMFGGGAHADSATATADVSLSIAVEPGALDLTASTCNDARLAAAAGDVSLFHPGLPTDVVVASTRPNNVETVCGATGGTATIDGETTLGAAAGVPATIELAWPTATPTTPTIRVTIDAGDLTVAEANTLAAGLLPGFDLLAQRVPVDIDLDGVTVVAGAAGGEAWADLVATVSPLSANAPSVPVGVLGSATRRAGSTDTIVALRVGDGASATFELGDLFPGTDLGLAAGLPLPGLTVAVTPEGADVDVATAFADRPLAAEFLADSTGSGPLLPTLRAGSMSIGAEVPLAPLGADVANFFGYDPGATVRLVGVADLSLDSIFSTPTDTIEYASLSMTLPALGPSGVLPDAVSLGETTLGLEYRSAGVGSTFALTFESSATVEVPDPDKSGGVQPLTADFSGELAIATDGSVSATFAASLGD